MKEINLTQGKTALVDDEDYEYLNQFKWYAQKHGRGFRVVRTASLKEGKNKKTLFMHKEILSYSGELDIDHIDCNSLNNQKNNLRLCTHLENCANVLGRNKQTKYKGITWAKKRKRWSVQIGHNKKRYWLGYFVNEIDAAKKYNEKAISFNSYYKLNKIENE